MLLGLHDDGMHISRRVQLSVAGVCSACSMAFFISDAHRTDGLVSRQLLYTQRQFSPKQVIRPESRNGQTVSTTYMPVMRFCRTAVLRFRTWGYVHAEHTCSSGYNRPMGTPCGAVLGCDWSRDLHHSRWSFQSLLKDHPEKASQYGGAAAVLCVSPHSNLRGNLVVHSLGLSN